MAFKPATKVKSKLRLALIGPSGSGKTMSALKIAQALGTKIAVIDSESGSASKYSDSFKFDTEELTNHAPENYTRAIKEAENAGYEVIIIDSLSHAWTGIDGALEKVDKAQKRSQSTNSFAAWREVTPLHNALVSAMVSSKCHVIATMRVKMEYVMEQNDRGKMVPRKVGLAPIQRDGVEYEFDVIADMNLDHDLIVSKTRCSAIDGLVVNKPGIEIGNTLAAWLNNGAEPPKAASAQPPAGEVPNAQNAGSQSVAPAQAKTEAASGSASPAQTNFDPASATTDPKSATANSADQTAQTAQSNASASSSAIAEKASPSSVTGEMMGQLLAAGKANGWSEMQVSEFVCFAFELVADATFLQKFTGKQWEIAIAIVSNPQNKNGDVKFKADGTALPKANWWPQVAA